MLTVKEWKAFAPNSKDVYTEAFTSEVGFRWLEYSGCLTSIERFAGFLGNCGHETGGFTVIRESLFYTTAARLRKVWPTRFGRLSDSQLAPYLRNERALAAKVYMGRMGNETPEDAYFFRGSGPLQSTGAYSYIKYGERIGVDFRVRTDLTDDMAVMLALACMEWQDGGCNELLDRGDYIGSCAKINVGSASEAAKRAVVGRDDRLKWHSRALRMWKGDPDWNLEPPTNLLVACGEDRNWLDAAEENGVA